MAGPGKLALQPTAAAAEGRFHSVAITELQSTALATPPTTYSQPRPVEWGKNIIAQCYPGGDRPIVHSPNYGDELVFGNNDFNHALDGVFRPYAPRTIMVSPAGSAHLVPQEFAAEAQATANYQQDLGLSGGIRVIGIPGPATLPLAQLVLDNAPWLRKKLDDMGIGPLLLPFIGSRRAVAQASALGRMTIPGKIDAVDLSNNKGFLCQTAARWGVPVAEGEWLHGTTTEVARETFYRLKQQWTNGFVFGKLCRAASGMGVWAISSADPKFGDFADFINDPNVQWQLNTPGLGIRLDREVPIDELPNIMMYVGKTAAEDRFICASTQLLVKRSPKDAVPTVHVGNISIDPATLAIIEPSLPPLLEMKRALGYEGITGFDFAVDKDAGVARLLEDNARLNGNNGASFPIIGWGPEAAWAAHNAVKVPHNVTREAFVAHLQNQGIHFDAASGYGVFVVNMATASLRTEGGYAKVQVGARGVNNTHIESMLARVNMV